MREAAGKASAARIRQISTPTTESGRPTPGAYGVKAGYMIVELSLGLSQEYSAQHEKKRLFGEISVEVLDVQWSKKINGQTCVTKRK